MSNINIFKEIKKRNLIGIVIVVSVVLALLYINPPLNYAVGVIIAASALIVFLESKKNNGHTTEESI